MTLTLNRPVGAVIAALAAATIFAPAASAGIDRDASFTTFPADFDWDGSQPRPADVNLSTGSFSGSISSSTNSADTLVPGYVAPTEGICGTRDEQRYNPATQNYDLIVKVPVNACYDSVLIRGGAVVPKLDPVGGGELPVGLAAGDVARVVHPTTQASLFDAAFTPVPAGTTSPIGGSGFYVSRSDAATVVSATLYRRVARNIERETFLPGTYAWELESTQYGKDDEVCLESPFDPVLNRRVKTTDVIPPKPTDVPPAGQGYYLNIKTYCDITRTAVPGAPWEAISSGRITGVSPTGYSGVFSVPIQAGDLLGYRESRISIAGDDETTISAGAIVPVGAVDGVVPTIRKSEFGAKSTSVKAFLKNGLSAFVTLDKPGTVKQEFVATVTEKKKKGKKKAKKKTVIVGTGAATTTTAGETAKVNLFATKDGRKVLKAVKKGKPLSGSLVTTVTDAAGNTVTSQAALKLSGK
ncbi:MAG: hypothetical protein Q7T55_04055 [Solirubrobacteraceae bacterium]|nr:hypothetical protein [Solirubrobacteraceae bacterium]